MMVLLMKKNKVLEYRDNLLTFLLIANSGMPFFTNNPWVLVYSLFFTAMFIKKYQYYSHRFFLITIGSLALLVIGQTIVFKLFSLKTTISLFVRWSYPFIYLYVIKDKFFDKYVNVLYILTIISLILHFSLIIFPPLQDILNSLSKYFNQTPTGVYSYNPNIVIFTTPARFIIDGVAIFRRNSGPFWEPGAFGIYLVLAFIINFYLTKNIWNKKNLVFLLAILTTWSTGTFVSIFFFIGLYGILIIRKKIYTLLIIPILLLAISQSYNKLSFFSDRIDRSILYFKERDQVSNMRRDRMISAIVDIQKLIKSPILGYGRIQQIRTGHEKFDTIIDHRNNGTTDFFVKYGIIFSLYYFMMIRRSFFYFNDSKKKSKIFADIVIATILLLGFYEVIFQMPVFITLYYFSVFFIRKEQYANTNYLSK